MQENVAELNARLKELVINRLPEAGSLETGVHGFSIGRHEGKLSCQGRCIGKPCCSLLIAGNKVTTLGTRVYRYGAGDCLVAGIDMPSSFHVMYASHVDPCIYLLLELKPELFTRLIVDHPSLTADLSSTVMDEGATVMEASLDLYRAFYRLFELIDDPRKAEVLAPLIIEELHYHLLVSKAGPVLKNYHALGAASNRIFKAISYLKNHVSTNLFINEVAAEVNMAPSTFYRHFKKVMGMTPVQFQKQLRLYEAQRLMLEGTSVSSAAFRVGYESTSQFSRDYKSFFGAPPNRDVRERMMNIAV